jgi:hypothetical protein
VRMMVVLGVRLMAHRWYFGVSRPSFKMH